MGSRYFPVQLAHWTETTVVALVNYLHLSVDKGHASLLFLLDMSVAFSTINHVILPRHLEAEEGIGGCALDWFKLFLMK